LMDMPDRKHEGVEITSEEWKAQKYNITPFKALFKFSWSNGEAVGRFLSELQKGRIIGRRCAECGRVMVPPRMFCEEDFSPTDDWVYVRDTGTIKTYSVSYLNADASRAKVPTVIAVIAIDGASEGMGFLHIIRGTPPEKVRIGMKVRAKWKPRARRKGAITDIEYFEAEAT